MKPEGQFASRTKEEWAPGERAPFVKRADNLKPEGAYFQPKNYSYLLWIAYTLHNVILCIGRNLLETRENIKISTHPFYSINLD